MRFDRDSFYLLCVGLILARVGDLIDLSSMSLLFLGGVKSAVTRSVFLVAAKMAAKKLRNGFQPLSTA